MKMKVYEMIYSIYRFRKGHGPKDSDATFTKYLFEYVKVTFKIYGMN